MSASAGRLLLVDDEPQILRAVTPALIAAGYTVEAALNGETALSKLANEPCDAVILDLGLPDMDGKDVIARVREWSEVPIIILSARHLEDEKIAALDAGADDYVNKPVGMGELLARIRATLRGRERRFASEATLRCGPLEVNFANRRVKLDGDEVRLTPREYDLLRTLGRHAGRVLTHRQIVVAVWGPESQTDAQALRVLMGQLRQKLEAEPSSPKLLLTEPGVGYRLSCDE